ncbi:polysaccharide pyruvyl transferase family protein [Citricoccus sp. GCM10030269]|uniref:polysaccharide pyruvyl transferase family protein n=1 Tax=Citricoccus sp. GCM10030269 TaxID=3273388 RepID=UPI0036125504
MRRHDLVAAYRDRPKVGLVGFFGWGNYGDELFVQLWRRALSRYFDVSVVHDLLVPPYLSEEPATVADRYEAFVIGGGDLVLTDRVSELYWRPEWLEKPVYICGVGVPLHDRLQRPPVIETMARFFSHPNVQYISARDEESAAWIRSHLRPRVPVLVHPDLVFGLQLPAPDPSLMGTAGQPTLGISVRQGKFGQDNDYTGLASLVRAARERGYAISAVELGNGRQRHRDAPALNQLPFTLDSVVSGRTPDEISAAIGSLTAFASMKFHGLLVALRYGVPALALTANTKNSHVLTDIGRPDLIADLDGGQDLAPRLRSLEQPLDPTVIRRLSADAADAVDALVRQLRVQLNPGSFRPRSFADTGAAWDSVVREALPTAVDLARRRTRLARMDRESERAQRH